MTLFLPFANGYYVGVYDFLCARSINLSENDDEVRSSKLFSRSSEHYDGRNSQKDHYWTALNLTFISIQTSLCWWFSSSPSASSLLAILPSDAIQLDDTLQNTCKSASSLKQCHLGPGKIIGLLAALFLKHAFTTNHCFALVALSQSQMCHNEQMHYHLLLSLKKDTLPVHRYCLNIQKSQQFSANFALGRSTAFTAGLAGYSKGRFISFKSGQKQARL